MSFATLPHAISHLSNKKISLMGMSGVGKTYLSNLLNKKEWFHYSIDYRIGTRYLHEEISDLLKIEAMKSPALAQLLRSDSIFIAPNLTIDNLAPLSYFVGMVGALDKGGIPLEEFFERLKKHRIAEINALKDTSDFIKRAKKIYGYPNFICDMSGSVCEIDSEEAIQSVTNECLLIYIKATDNMKTALIERAQTHPKPLYYQAEFLENAVKNYCNAHHLNSWKEIDPSNFAIWVFPQLVEHRLTRYESIAHQFGITIDANLTQNISSESAFLALIDQTLQQHHSR